MSHVDVGPVPSTDSLSLRFGDLDILYDMRTLKPRPWTLAQSDWAAELLQDAAAGPVLELCAGAGHIGLHAVHNTERNIVLVDRNEVACSYARLNAAHAQMSERCDIRAADFAVALRPEERFPVIIADPPWVQTESIGRFPEDPRGAIDGGRDGLDVARACLQIIADHLSPGGSAILQLGTRAQAASLQDHLSGMDGLGLGMESSREFADGLLVRLVHGA